MNAAFRPARLAVLVALAAALAFAGLAALAARQAHAARGMEVMLQDDSVFVTQKTFEREAAFAKAKQFGVSTLRINVQWAFTQTPAQAKSKTRPAGLHYQWQLIDSAIDAAARHGIRAYLTLTGPAPAWAASNHKVGPSRPNPTAYGEWAALAAQHFKGRVARYSIWNEPNIRGWLSPVSAAPSIYRKLYTNGYKAIKTVDPGAKVLIAETSPYAIKIGGKPFASSPLGFLRKMLCVNKSYKHGKCGKFKADGFAHHPYDFKHAANFKLKGKDNATMGTLKNLTKALDKLSRSKVLRHNGGGKMPVYLTEYGYFASGHRALSKKKRTKYLNQGWNIALKNSRVKGNLQYLLNSPKKGSSSAFFDLALLNNKGKAYPQFKTLVHWYKAHKRKVKKAPSSISLPPARAF